MNNNSSKNMIRSLLIMAAMGSLASYATEYTPAKFGDAASVLTQHITLPSSFGEGVKTVAVYCQADVLTTGDLNNINCYENNSLLSMKASTESALKSATFSAASIDSQAIPVRMQFRVIYSISGTQAPIVLLPNLGTLQAKYGVDYFAPQERLDKHDWYVQYSTKTRGDGKLFFADSKVTRVMANIEADGVVESVSTIEAAARKKADADTIESALKKSRFIPGFVQDKATPMHYIAVVNYEK
ncbi:hypothetical protein [Cellvibrio japonicus]|uniref:TonB C-terminal domain-containing protein n=1 Tax=Cellvibrio japonicus (strain Ueda107) TaxID=498211 RepID=B3PK00_CELJU|nr:hypothetical protein [Cellvibrio japonicus]ACE85807.1 hypothetical protein CJA_2362 [Cellvibrio japonicus Ueda107]